MKWNALIENETTYRSWCTKKNRPETNKTKRTGITLHMKITQKYVQASKLSTKNVTLPLVCYYFFFVFFLRSFHSLSLKRMCVREMQPSRAGSGAKMWCLGRRPDEHQPHKHHKCKQVASSDGKWYDIEKNFDVFMFGRNETSYFSF